MRTRLLILMTIVLSCLLEAQTPTAPSGRTANFGYRKYPSNAVYIADSLNADKDSIDSDIRDPGWNIVDSTYWRSGNKKILRKAPAGLKANYTISPPDTTPGSDANGYVQVTSANGTSVWIPRDSLGTAGGGGGGSGSVTDSIWVQIWSTAHDTLTDATTNEAIIYNANTTRTKVYAYFKKDSLVSWIRFWGTETVVGGDGATVRLYVADSLLSSRSLSAGTASFEAIKSIDHIANGTYVTVRLEIVTSGGNSYKLYRSAIEVSKGVETAGGGGSLDSTASGQANPLYNFEYFEDFLGNPKVTTASIVYKELRLTHTGSGSGGDTSLFGNARGVAQMFGTSGAIMTIVPYTTVADRGTIRLNEGTTVFQIRLQRKTNSASNDSLRWGWMSIELSGGGTPARADIPPTSGVYFQAFENNGDSVWAYVKNGATVDSLNTGYVATTGSWRTYQASISDTTITFTVDGVVVGTKYITLPGTLHDFVVYNKTPAVSFGVLVDYIWLRQTGINRRW